MSGRLPDGFEAVLHAAVAAARSRRAAHLEESGIGRRVTSAIGGFAGHRPYHDGDDARLVDWNAYARSRELVVKTFEDERRNTRTILLDDSASMGVGTRFDDACAWVALIAAVALGRGDRVLLATRDQVLSYSGLLGLRALVDRLERLEASGGSIEWDLRQVPVRGRVLWVSDFADLNECGRVLPLLGPRRRPITAWMPHTSEDDLPDLDGTIRLVDPETGRTEDVRVDAGLRRRLERALAEHARERESLFRRLGVQTHVVDTPRAVPPRASAWLVPRLWAVA